MSLYALSTFWGQAVPPVWRTGAPIREELFGVERLEQHAASLAAAQQVTTKPRPVLALATRLDDNARILLASYRASTTELEEGRNVEPAAEWLLDNYHVVEQQIRQIRDDLPPGYYRQLPKLSAGPLVGYPRVFGLAWAFVAHTDSHFDPEILRRFVTAYQRVQPLTIGELWAVAITLRLVLIENLRRLAVQITEARALRARADDAADRLLESSDRVPESAETILASLDTSPLPELFASQLAKRLRDQDPRVTPARGWLEERLDRQDSSIEEVVYRAQQRQGASNVTVRNIITSMRLISDTDWARLFEAVSLVDERLRGASAFAEMDFPTRNLYRSAVEDLARGSNLPEIEVAERALLLAAAASDGRDGQADIRRLQNPGYYLVAGGRAALERAIGFRPPLRLQVARLSIRLGIGGYVGSILTVTASLLGLILWALARLEIGPEWLLLLGAAGFFPAMTAATALVDRAVTTTFGATTLPGLELAEGIPPHYRTLIAVPTLLTSEEDLLEQVERLEVHHLASPGGDLYFALLSDGLDAERETVEGDARLLAAAAEGIARLNRIYGSGADGERFLLLHRRRTFNRGEGRWMGWERKRGKLHELNRLLRGAMDTTFMNVDGRAPAVPSEVRYVITLDADTRLPRDSARRLIGKMAHPLNQPRFDPQRRRIVEGYGVLQPRVTPSLPTSREGSVYQRVSSGPGGMDPYASAVSDVYQDLFGQGSYTGKGIYEIDAFEMALDGRVPPNALLSHDLFEGIFARAGLASDIEVVEDFPSRYDVAAKRQHRWVRGDWQLLPWIIGGRRRDGGGVPPIGLVKMLDNLKRSALSPLALAALFMGWLLPLPAALGWSAFIFATIAVPALIPILFAVLPRRAGITPRSHFGAFYGDVRLAFSQIVLHVVFLADQAWRTSDAIGRTLFRLFVSRRHLLEWVTAAQTRVVPRLDIFGFYREMSRGVALGTAACAGAAAFAPSSWPVVLPFALIWLAAPAIALWASRPPAVDEATLSDADARELRLIARRTWRFFETFVTPSDNMLPPDNFQEDPRAVIAHRTSPTNIGLYLLSSVAARDLGWAGTMETVDRLEATIASLNKLDRFKGHFFNWYDTSDLRVLDPAYVSSVDSGNLAGHLIVLANACREWIDEPIAMSEVRRGIGDTFRLAGEALEGAAETGEDIRQRLARGLDEMSMLLRQSPSDQKAIEAQLQALVGKAARMTAIITEEGGPDPDGDLVFWMRALEKVVAEHARDFLDVVDPRSRLKRRMTAVAAAAREMALSMDFAFLLDPDRELLSIGFSVAENSRDTSCYDLLASEARLASLFAIAKGDVLTKHWFRLGRAATPLGKGSALISWSGSMFEYLMPSLVMRAPVGSILEQTNKLIVVRQQAYGRVLGIPWGISESAYNARDREFTYQYSNFGVPGLGLKRGLSENAVIAPYATGLAAMIDAHGAVRNFARLERLGARGRYGFYEALDFTRARLPDGVDVALVRNVMAHHQGMTIVALANTLQNARMRGRFHAEPMIQACDLLLQERMPRDVAVSHPRAEEVQVAAKEAPFDAPPVRRLKWPVETPPATHLFSNGRYGVMLTSAGSGYSRWRDLAVTRWHEDATRDDWGSYVFLKDIRSGAVWSAGFQPSGAEPDSYNVVFSEDHAEFIRHDGALTTTLEVLVSAEDDGEVRRVSLVNSGSGAREIEFTSYAEIVLATPAADNAHPAFSKMFVQTEYLAELAAIVATRRRRSPGEPEVWAAHLAVVEGEAIAEQQIETDRARFIGRGRTIREPVAVTGNQPFSNSVGTVLDPIFALRHRLVIRPGNVARIAFWTVVASSRADLLNLVDKHRDRNAFERARTLAWTQAQVQLRHLGVKADEAADFQRLAGYIVHADRRLRPPSDVIIRGAGAQSGLWPYGISGDVPIVLLRIDDVEDIDNVRQLLRAHEYWRMRQLAVDLVIVNERRSSYVQDLQIAIEASVRSTQSAPRPGEAPAGTVFTLRADLMTVAARALLESTARIVLVAGRGGVAEQIARLAAASVTASAGRRRGATSTRVATASRRSAAAAGPDLVSANLEFFNGLGGFAKDGREYVMLLQRGRSTPAPWINVVANPSFGFQVAAEGSSYTWSENSRENQLTPWSNDPVTDPSGEALYVRDEETGDLWSPTASPIRDDELYVAHHGHGYSRFEHTAHGIALDLLQFVPVDDPIKISRLTLKNVSGRARRLSVTAYLEWVLGTSRGASAAFIMTEIDAATGAMLVRNPWNTAFAGRVAFADLGGCQTAWTGDRCEFLGRNGSLADPVGLREKAPLSGRTGAGLDPCSALYRKVDLEARESVEIVVFLGEVASAEEARTVIRRYRAADLNTTLAAVEHYWEDLLGAVQVKTPDRAMDIMLNGWLLYQTLACRMWARSAFYQASGAFGFRDQLQDGMALTFARPEMTRHHLLRAAARQFVEGDVQHWWLPSSGQGVRSRISDDRVWLAYGVASYVEATGDASVLDEIVPFLEGPTLRPGEHDAFFQPRIADVSASLFEHCARALDQCLTLTGPDGIPLIGTGDWNDGMNRVGEGGRGQSIWLGWLLLKTIGLFAPFADSRDPERACRWRAHALAVRAAIESEGWDGAWYRRGTFDDGTPLGSSSSEECRIDSIAQSWAVLSDAADTERAAKAMAAVEKHLIRADDGVALLFAPPFDKTPLDPGYIKGYPPGLRENGGQYSHAAMWAVMAFAKIGQGDRAAALFSLLNPINHARSPVEMLRYKVEPYVVAADVYSVAPHTGRGGWTWYTGSAGWMYRAGIESILGVRQRGTFLIVDPCIPKSWPGFQIALRHGATQYEILVENLAHTDRGGGAAELDGIELRTGDGPLQVPLDGGTHRLRVSLGHAGSSSRS